MGVAVLPPLIALAAIGALILVLAAYKATLGPVIDWLIVKLGAIRLHIPGITTFYPFAPLIGALQAFQNLVYHTLAGLIDAEQAVWNKTVSWTAYAWSEVSGAVADVGHGAEAAIHTLRHSIVPVMIHGLTDPLGTVLYPLVTRVASLAAQLAHTATHTTKVVIHQVTPAITKVERITKVVYRDVPAAAAKAVAIPFPRIGAAEREAAAAAKWIRANAKKLTAAGIVGLTVAALGRLGLGWTRCSNVGKLGKQVCGMDGGLLGALLGEAVVIFSLVSLVEFASALVSIQEGVAQTILAGFRETSNIDLSQKFTGYTGTLG